MKIATQSNIAMSSAYSFRQTYRKTEDLQIWDNRGPAVQPGNDKVIISNTFKGLVNEARHCKKSSSSEDKGCLASSDKHYLLALLIAALTGEDISILDVEKLNKKIENMRSQGNDAQQAYASQQSNGIGGQMEGWGIRYTATETYTEQEKTAFSADGAITTEDGRSLNFSVSLLMERTYSTSSTVDFRAGDALKDPLVINFGQNRATLGEKVNFDIDSDGAIENMAFVRGDSGFLAIDKNSDGVINDGTELFGPSTGDGFGELGLYDSDKNGWIDENDPVFNELRVWVKEGENETLYTLKDVSIGAIYADSVKTPFEIKDENNNLQAMIRQTGFYLRENGTAGTVQKIDIAV